MTNRKHSELALLVLDSLKLPESELEFASSIVEMQHLEDVPVIGASLRTVIDSASDNLERYIELYVTLNRQFENCDDFLKYLNKKGIKVNVAEEIDGNYSIKSTYVAAYFDVSSQA